MRIHHIGYLVKNIEKSSLVFEELGYVVQGDAVYDEYRDVNILFMKKDGYVIELIAPVSKKSVVYGLMARYKNMPYHVCYCTADFDKTLSDFTANKYAQISEPCPAPAIGDKRVVFLMNSAIGMIELLEEGL